MDLINHILFFAQCSFEAQKNAVTEMLQKKRIVFGFEEPDHCRNHNKAGRFKQ